MIVCIQGDALNTLEPTRDSSLFIAAELIKLGCHIFYYEPQNLYVNNNSYIASGAFINVQHYDGLSNYSILESTMMDLGTAGAILIRQDPPYNMQYITNTYLLENLLDKVFITNNPKGIRNMPEKLSALALTQKLGAFLPDTIIASALNQNILQFTKKYRKIVVKPLYGFGGHDIISLDDNAHTSKMLEDQFQKHGQLVIQQFLPQIHKGDKRIMLINGEPKAAIIRVPKPGEFRANLGLGGTAEPTDITQHERNICNILKPLLLQNEILFAAIDMIGEYLIEVNVTSPTGLIAVNRLYNLNLAKELAEIILLNIGK